MIKSRVFIAALFLIAAGAAFAADYGLRSVTVEETTIVDKPSALGKVLGVLAYGDKVMVLAQPAGASKAWLKVKSRDGKLQGWIRNSALTQKEVAMSSSSEGDVATASKGFASEKASSADVAAAGKGFTAQVEEQYKKDQNLDYTWVDNMQGKNEDKKEFKVSQLQLATFLTSGGLSDGGAE